MLHKNFPSAVRHLKEEGVGPIFASLFGARLDIAGVDAADADGISADAVDVDVGDVVAADVEASPKAVWIA